MEGGGGGCVLRIITILRHEETRSWNYDALFFFRKTLRTLARYLSVTSPQTNRTNHCRIAICTQYNHFKTGLFIAEKGILG